MKNFEGLSNKIQQILNVILFGLFSSSTLYNEHMELIETGHEKGQGLIYADYKNIYSYK